MQELKAFVAWVREWLAWPFLQIGHHIGLEVVVTLGGAISAGGVSLFQGEDVLRAIVVGMLGGLGAMLLLYVYGLAIAPYRMHQEQVLLATEAAKQETCWRNRVLNDADRTILLIDEAIHSGNELASEMKDLDYNDKSYSERDLERQLREWIRQVHAVLAAYSSELSSYFGDPEVSYEYGELAFAPDAHYHTLERLRKLAAIRERLVKTAAGSLPTADQNAQDPRTA